MAPFEIEDEIPFPIEDCFLALRDHEPDLAPYLDDISTIDCLERREEPDGRIFTLFRWRSDYEPPKVVSRFISADMREWYDHVLWDHRNHRWHWRFEHKRFASAFSCEGENRMEPLAAERTRIVLTGKLDIAVERIPGVPGFLGRKMRPAVEKFIINLISPNLRGIVGGLTRFLEAQRDGDGRL